MKHFLNGIEISPRNRDSIGVVSDFTGNPDFLSLNVDTIILPREANDIVKQHIQQNGLFIGIPYTVDLNGVTLDYYVDLSDATNKPMVRQHEIEIKIKKRNGNDSFWERANGTSWELIHSKNPELIDPKLKDIGYYVIRDNYAEMVFSLSIATFMLTKEIIETTKEIAEQSAEIFAGTLSVSNALLAAAKVIIRIIYWATLVIALISMLEQLFKILFPRRKFLKGMYYHDLLKAGCQYLGYNVFPSSITFPNNPGWFILPIPLQESNESFFDKISGDLPDYFNKGWPTASDTIPTFGDFLRECEKQFNAKILIDPFTKTVVLERRDWLQQSTQLALTPALNLQPTRDDQYTYNTEDTWKRYYIRYALDFTDTHTVDGYMYGIHDAEYSTENSLTVINQDLITIKGLNEVSINFAMGADKGKLSALEAIAVPFALLCDFVTRILTFGNGGTQYAAQILDRVNALKISNEYFGITKSLFVKPIPGTSNRVSLKRNQYDSDYSATALWNKYHYINFIANNDYIIRENARLRIHQSDFVSLLQNNYAWIDGKLCEILRLEWIDEKSDANITYKEPNDWANGKVTLLKID